MVEINSNSYKTMVDKLGKEYLYAECEYYNDVTYGKFTINKIGPELCKKEDENDSADENTDGIAKTDLVNKNGSEGETTGNDGNKSNDIVVNLFNYKDTLLNGVVFELTPCEAPSDDETFFALLPPAAAPIITITAITITTIGHFFFFI